jgi:hypothetical protein
MTVFCGPGLFLVPAPLVGASIAAIWLRALIRIRSAARRGVDLHRIDPPARERPAPLPERSEPRAATPLPAPSAPEAPAQAGEPRLLR